MQKKSTLMTLMILVLAASAVLAQNEGVILYEVTINNHRMLPPDRQEMKAMVPEFRVFKQQLFFNKNESLYKQLIEDDEEEDMHAGGGGHGRMILRMPPATNYFDQASSIMLTQMDMMGKKYLIVDTLKPAPWKFGTETKVIQGYECTQAYYTTDDERKQTITAWFTPKLRPSLGPDSYNTLPGAVLAVDINNGERVIVAKKVELRELKKNEMKAPTDGERLSRAEFRKRGDEMRKQFKGGNVIIRN